MIYNNRRSRNGRLLKIKQGEDCSEETIQKTKNPDFSDFSDLYNFNDPNVYNKNCNDYLNDPNDYNNNHNEYNKYDDSFIKYKYCITNAEAIKKPTNDYMSNKYIKSYSSCIFNNL